MTIQYVNEYSSSIITIRDERELIFHSHSLPFPFVHSIPLSARICILVIPVPIHHPATIPIETIPSHFHSRSTTSRFECDVM
jgi:hypothetical protein